MTATTLDRLLATLNVELSAFAHCEVQHGHQLHFAAMDMTIVHYVLSGRGVIVLSNGSEAELLPGRMVIVPPGQGQWLGTDNRDRPLRVAADVRSARLEWIAWSASPPESRVRIRPGHPSC